MIPNIHCGDRLEHGRHLVTTGFGQSMCPGSEAAVKLVITSPAPAAGSWTCHICGDERPDERISVRQHITNADGGFTVTQNVRYCNDRTHCIVESINYRHIPGLDSRGTSPNDPQPVDNPVDSHLDRRAETAGTVPDPESDHRPRES